MFYFCLLLLFLYTLFSNFCLSCTYHAKHFCIFPTNLLYNYYTFNHRLYFLVNHYTITFYDAIFYYTPIIPSITFIYCFTFNYYFYLYFLSLFLYINFIYILSNLYLYLLCIILYNFCLCFICILYVSYIYNNNKNDNSHQIITSVYYCINDNYYQLYS